MRNLFEQNRVKNGFKQLCKARIGLLVYKYGLSDVVLVDLHLLTIFRIPTLISFMGTIEVWWIYFRVNTAYHNSKLIRSNSEQFGANSEHTFGFVVK